VSYKWLCVAISSALDQSVCSTLLLLANFAVSTVDPLLASLLLCAVALLWLHPFNVCFAAKVFLLHVLHAASQISLYCDVDVANT
jgi:hypothetical protein